MKTLVTLLFIYMLFSEALQASAALRCYQCEGSTCHPKPLDCPSGADRCQTTTIEANGQKMTIKGCAHKADCDQLGDLKNVTASVSPIASAKPKCCDTDLCNGAEGVKLSLLIMLVPLISSTLII